MSAFQPSGFIAIQQAIRILSFIVIAGLSGTCSRAQDSAGPVTADLLLDTAARGESFTDLVANDLDDDVVDELIHVARRRTHPDQIIAIRVLGEWKGEAAIPVLCQNLFQSDRSVRTAAMQALIQIGPIVESSVRRVLDSEATVAHSECLAILIRHRQIGPDELTTWITSKAPRVRATIAAEIDGNDVAHLSILAALAEDPEVAVCTPALTSLAQNRTQPAKAVQILRKALSRDATKAVAMNALIDLGIHARRSYSDLIRFVAEYPGTDVYFHDRDIDYRLTIGPPDPRDLPELEQMLLDPKLQMEASMVIGMLGVEAKESASVVQKALSEAVARTEKSEAPSLFGGEAWEESVVKALLETLWLVTRDDQLYLSELESTLPHLTAQYGMTQMQGRQAIPELVPAAVQWRLIKELLASDNDSIRLAGMARLAGMERSPKAVDLLIELTASEENINGRDEGLAALSFLVDACPLGDMRAAAALERAWNNGLTETDFLFSISSAQLATPEIERILQAGVTSGELLGGPALENRRSFPSFRGGFGGGGGVGFGGLFGREPTEEERRKERMAHYAQILAAVARNPRNTAEWFMQLHRQESLTSDDVLSLLQTLHERINFPLNGEMIQLCKTHLNSSNMFQRQAALSLLGTAGPAARAHLDEIRRLTADIEDRVAIQAGASVYRITSDASDLRRVLHTRRIHTQEALEILESLGEEAAPFVEYILKHPENEYVERDRINTLRVIGGTEARDGLSRIAQSVDWEIRYRATQALRELEDRGKRP